MSSNINDIDTQWNVPTLVTPPHIKRQLLLRAKLGMPTTPPKQPFNWRAFAIGAVSVEVCVLVLLKVSQVA